MAKDLGIGYPKASQIALLTTLDRVRNANPERDKPTSESLRITSSAYVGMASPQTWVLAMKNPRILRGLRRFYRNDQDH